MEDMILTTFVLKILWDVICVMPIASPSAIRLWLRVRTRPAIDLFGWLSAMTDVLGWAELTGEPCRIF
jgi:hypothetical protein